MFNFFGYLNFNFNISKLEQKKIIVVSNYLSNKGFDKTFSFINNNLYKDSNIGYQDIL
jgi:hypothetical protein